MKKAKSIQLTPGGAPEKHILKSEKNDIEYKNLTADGQAIAFKVSSLSVITHDEHDRIVLTSGEYVKTNQVEFNPFTKTIDYVFD